MVYINDVSKQVHSGCLISIFADDILMHLEIGCAEDYDLFQENIEDVSTWIAHQHMFLNVNKCKYMIISRKRAPTLPKISLILMSSPLERVSKFKYLGVWLVDNLSWSYHIKETSTKATKMAGMIYRKFYPVCNTATMLQLYVSYIRPLLEYAVPVWDPHTASNSRVMENVQKFSVGKSGMLVMKP